MITINTENGTTIYTENALANIVGINVMEVPGVQGLVAKNTADGLFKLLQKENYSKGIKIEEEDNKLLITISIAVSFGSKFSEIAKNIHSTVKYNVETLTDIKVKNITVIVQEVRHNNEM